MLLTLTTRLEPDPAGTVATMDVSLQLTTVAVWLLMVMEPEFAPKLVPFTVTLKKLAAVEGLTDETVGSVDVQMKVA